jgi:glycosyltransferase involved in cell wall biosynthesis
LEIFAIVEGVDHVCTRYRLSAFQNALANAGFELKLSPWPSSLWSRIKLIRSLAGKTVIIQRKLIASSLVWLLRKTASKIVFDFDDAVFLRDSYSSKGIDDPGRLRRFRAICNAADAIVAGNGFLAQNARLACAKATIATIPTCVETTAYPLRQQHPANNTFDLVWIGSSSTLNSLKLIEPCLEAIGETFPQVQLKIICDRFPVFKKLRTLECPWTAREEIQHICQADAGICHMPDDRWSEGKCGLKLLQYMAAGLPSIANPVGVHKEIIIHGQTGFLADTKDQWLDAVAKLLNNSTLQREMGQQARLRAENSYSVLANQNAWIHLLKNVTSSLKTKAG